MGSIIDLEQGGARRLRLYITGDTLNSPVLADIPRRFPDINAMLIHLGGTRVLGLLVTMDGRQGAEVVDLMRPGLTLPIHYDDYRAFRPPLQHFLDATRRHEPASTIRPLSRGETLPLLDAAPPARPSSAG